MTEALSESAPGNQPPVDVPLNLMEMAIALLDREDESGSVSACLLQEAIDARSKR